jgi:hypothetical protein
MPSLPQNSTGRVLVDYLANGRNHTVQFRYAGGGAPDNTFLESVDDFLISCNPLMPSDWTFLRARQVWQGGTISTPLSFAPTPFAGIRTPQVYELPAFVSFIGRTTGGRRTRIYLLGAGFDPSESGGVGADYRIRAAENTSVAAAISTLSGSPVVGIDGLDPLWYSYVNAGYNAYWQRQARG